MSKSKIQNKFISNLPAGRQVSNVPKQFASQIARASKIQNKIKKLKF